MTLTQPSRYLLGLALTANAGWVAAIGFLELGGLYVSFVSGNTIQIGLNAERAYWPLVSRSAAAVALFVAGAFAGGLLALWGGRWTFALTLAVEALALACGAATLIVLPEMPLVLIGLLALAMGLQNHVVARYRPDGSGTTFVTGVIFRMGDALARTAAGRDRSGLWLLSLAVTAAFGAGAAAAAFCETRLGAAALVPPAAVICLLSVAIFLREALRPARGTKTP